MSRLDELAERIERLARGKLHSLVRKAPTSVRCWAYDPGFDQCCSPVDVRCNRCEPGDGAAVLGYGDLFAGFDPIEIAAQLVLQLAYADGDGNPYCGLTHGFIVARLGRCR